MRTEEGLPQSAAGRPAPRAPFSVGAAPFSRPSVHPIRYHCACIDTALRQTVPASRKKFVRCDKLQEFALVRSLHEAFAFSLFRCACSVLRPDAFSRSTRSAGHAPLHPCRMGLADSLRHRLQFARRHKNRYQSLFPSRSCICPQACPSTRRRRAPAEVPSQGRRSAAAHRETRRRPRRRTRYPRPALPSRIPTSFPAAASTKCMAGIVFSFFLDLEADHHGGARHKGIVE